MVRCPNCGQKTSGDYCHCCKYPILKGKRARALKAEIAAGEKTKQEAEETRKAREAEKLAKKQAEIAAREKAKQEAEEAAKEIRPELYEGVEPGPSLPIEFDQAKYLEGYLKQVESTREELKDGEINTKEAIQRLQDISGKISERIFSV